MGIKLLTPVQYDHPLGGLNALRPMELDEITKRSIDIAVVDSGEDAGEGSTLGRFVGCNPQGAILSNADVKYDNVEFITKGFDYHTKPDYITFSQKVYGVNFKVLSFNRTSNWYWCDEGGFSNYRGLSAANYRFVPFVGKTMWFNFAFDITGSWTVGAYGLY